MYTKSVTHVQNCSSVNLRLSLSEVIVAVTFAVNLSRVEQSPFQKGQLKRAFAVISRKVVGKSVQTAIPKGIMGYDQYTVPDTVTVKPTFAAFLKHLQT